MSKKTTTRICERCNATIPDEWDNEHHYGTCPSCHRGSNFILNNPELQHIAEHENHLQKTKTQLQQYDVVQTNQRSGVSHVNCVQLAKLIYGENGYHFKTIEDIDSGKQVIYYYMDGYYHRGGENRVKEEVDRYLDDLSTIHRKKEVVDYIQNMNHIGREHIEPPLHLINVKNGIYNLETKTLEKHNPDFFFLNQIPINYNPDSTCPQIEQFMIDVLYKEYVAVVQEMFGYCLYRSYRYHKAFLLYGGGRNGKSCMQELLENMLGEHNYVSNGLHDLLDNRYASSSMYGKLANMGSEISGGALSDTAQFKHLTGNDTVRAERKYFGSFGFRNYAKLIFNSNYIPYSKYDKSKAYFDRWIILVFPQTFEQGQKKTDTHIMDKLTTRQELEGCLLWAIAGFERLLSQDKFSYDDNLDEDEIGERYELLTKPDKQYIMDNLELVSGESTDSEIVYKGYIEWAEQRKYPIATKTAFSRSVKRYLYDRESKKHPEIKTVHRGDKYVKVYMDVKMKDVPSESLRLDSFGDNSTDMEVTNTVINTKPMLGDK